ncbi:hypothetical protein AB4Y89_07175 [Terriglobus sp. 2YAB30_2]|uniref:hypothetical protein n=1 Tax=unclassified Terriglobus TaxID=2628988 RepID=UPI003F96D793
MSDQLYLSLWFPNFRLEALPAALISVLQQFARISGDSRVSAASAIPIDWTESPTYQRIYVNDERSEESDDARIENAVREATEQLHDDTAYEFEMKWQLWLPESVGGFDTTWRLQPYTVKVSGFGPEFDEGAYDQNGHIRVDFGLDTPWVLEDEDLDKTAQQKIQQNIEKLLAFTLSVEKHSGISSRLLWTESGEPLAEKLVASLQRLN